ncbi:MAG TPA: kelch repeat-containing protein [Acidobacteriaceae bacterium]
MPSISSITPGSLVAGSASQTLTVSGSGFIASTVVNLNGTALATTYVSATSVTATVPALAIAADGTEKITVSNPLPGGGISQAQSFTITVPPPVVTSLSPQSVPQSAAVTITVNGTGFEANSVVLWNGSARTTTFVNATTLQVALTATDVQNFGTGQISVANPGLTPTTPIALVIIANTPTNEWTWISGSTVSSVGLGPAGVYGTLGTESASNIPGGRGVATGWADSSGNLWIFGGFGLDATGTKPGELNDLWKFDPKSNQWTWMGGSNTINVPGVYGTQGIAAATNVPGARQVAANWADASGNFWIFGGAGYDASGQFFTLLNDLWFFAPASNTWTWMGGSKTGEATGVYGTLGIPAAENLPGAREESVAWTDTSGNFWMFSGWGWDSKTETIDLNDLWKYNPRTQQWTWVGGSNVGGSSGIYGTLGTPNSANWPGAREGASSWVDANGSFWLFGGYGFDSMGNRSSLNDLWEFSPSAMEWNWVSGSNQVNAPGIYGLQGTSAASNVPGARKFATTWKDNSGNLWLLGGNGYAASGASGELNDLWTFNLASKQWTWAGGSNQINASATYGVEGAPGSANVPGSRDAAIGITDVSGNFWLFGGYTGSSSGPDSVSLNDLWRYQP